MKRPEKLWVFFGSAIFWFLLMTLLWLQISAWTSYPAGVITRMALNSGAPVWIKSTTQNSSQLEADTRVKVEIPGRGVGMLVAEVKTGRYAYGLPLFFALLLAARSKHLLRRLLFGYLVLLIPQSFSLIFDVLKQIMVAAGSPAALKVSQWQLEVIALGYQCGSLLLPTLAPVALWLWLDREFFVSVIFEGFMRKTVGK